VSFASPFTTSSPSLPRLESFAEMLDALPCAALLVSSQGRIVLANDAAVELLATSRPKLQATRLVELMASEVATPEIQNFHDSGQFETVLRRGDGGDRAVIVSHRRVELDTDDVGEGPLHILTLADIHKLKDTEASLKFQQTFLVEMSDTVMQQALELKELNQQLEARVLRRTAEIRDANMDAIYMLAVAAEAKDYDTGAHVLRIQRYSQTIALTLGLSETEADEIGYSSILHDVGKLHVPDQILNKPGPLDEFERRQMEEHTIVGERILSTRPFFARARVIARSHHENWDGTGYPDKTAGESIPIEARIVHVADVYDALTTPRPYKEAWDPDTALRSILDSSGGQFDPKVAAVLESLNQNDGLRSLIRGFCELPSRPL
jgi:HD-GYP domain-containing protein (c-di-GMP phosphodiesterase class II)